MYFGSREVAEILVDAGAPDYRPPGGDWADIDFWDQGGEPLTSGDEVGVTSWLSSFHHLWFLWFLLWLIGGFAIIALAVDRFGKDREHPAAWTGWLMWALIPLTLLPQLAMGDFGENPTFGPETSTGLLPIPHVLVYYAVFFAFGALLFGRRSRDRDRMLVDRIGGWWLGLLPAALLVLYPVGLWLTFDIVDRSWRYCFDRPGGVRLGHDLRTDGALPGAARQGAARRQIPLRLVLLAVSGPRAAAGGAPVAHPPLGPAIRSQVRRSDGGCQRVPAGDLPTVRALHTRRHAPQRQTGPTDR